MSPMSTRQALVVGPSKVQRCSTRKVFVHATENTTQDEEASSSLASTQDQNGTVPEEARPVVTYELMLAPGSGEPVSAIAKEMTTS